MKAYTSDWEGKFLSFGADGSVVSRCDGKKKEGEAALGWIK